MYQILVCDDEADIVSALKIYLTSEGYGVLEAHNGKEAVEIVREKEVHLVLLDIMMPELDGISAMIKIRQISNIPVLLLTAKSEDTDKILGLNVGADDYITKPFNPVEVLARVKSNLRRYTELGSAIHNESVLQVGSIVLDNESKSVQVDGEPVALTPTEYDILHLLMKNPGKVFSSADIYNIIRGDNPYGVDNTIAVHIRHLREKLEINPAEPRYLKVVWGQGYKIEKAVRT